MLSEVRGKKLAIDEIIERDGIDVDEILYIGDSITDVEPLSLQEIIMALAFHSMVMNIR